MHLLALHLGRVRSCLPRCDFPCSLTRPAPGARARKSSPFRSSYTVDVTTDAAPTFVGNRVGANTQDGAMSEQRDDIDLEVSSLQPAAGPTGTDAQDRNGASPPDTRALRLPRQQRLLRAGSVFVLLTLLVCAVLLIPTGNRAAVLHLLTPPTLVPTATPKQAMTRSCGSTPFPGENSSLMASQGPTCAGRR
jgi:hypothetical protein